MTKPIRLELPTPFSIGSVNGWLFVDPEPVLVDCGQKTPDCLKAIEDGLAAEGLTVADLKKVIITHAHVDHAGTARYIADHSDAEIWVSDYAWDWICNLEAKWEDRIDMLRKTAVHAGVDAERIHKMAAGMMSVLEIWQPVPADRMVRFNTKSKLAMGGERWDVIYAPGHTQTQTCFYEPQSKRLISADMLLHIAPVPVIERYAQLGDDGEPVRVPGLPTHIASMRRFRELEVSAVYPGHGPEFKDPHTVVIDRQLGRINMRKEQCYELIVNGNQTAMEITDIMYSHFPEGGKLTGMAMVIGYIDLLIQEKRVSQDVIDGVWHFSPTSQSLIGM